LSAEMESLRSKNSNLEALVSQLRIELSSLGSSSLPVTPSPSSSEYEFKISELNRELLKTVASLKEAVANGKLIQEKYEEERDKNSKLKLEIIELDNTINKLKDSKDMISSTILDSLHKEKEKNSKLEIVLQTRSPLSSSYNVVGADVFDEERQLDNPKLLASSPPEAPPSAQTAPTTKHVQSPSSSSVTGDASPKLSMLEELRRMREELRRIEEAGPILSPVSSNTTHSALSGEQRSDVNSDTISASCRQDLTDDIEFQRPKTFIYESNRSSSSCGDVIIDTVNNLDDSKV